MKSLLCFLNYVTLTSMKILKKVLETLKLTNIWNTIISLFLLQCQWSIFLANTKPCSLVVSSLPLFGWHNDTIQFFWLGVELVWASFPNGWWKVLIGLLFLGPVCGPAPLEATSWQPALSLSSFLQFRLRKLFLHTCFYQCACTVPQTCSSRAVA